LKVCAYERASSCVRVFMVHTEFKCFCLSVLVAVCV